MHTIRASCAASSIFMIVENQESTAGTQKCMHVCWHLIKLSKYTLTNPDFAANFHARKDYFSRVFGHKPFPVFLVILFQKKMHVVPWTCEQGICRGRTPARSAAKRVPCADRREWIPYPFSEVRQNDCDLVQRAPCCPLSPSGAYGDIPS